MTGLDTGIDYFAVLLLGLLVGLVELASRYRDNDQAQLRLLILTLLNLVGEEVLEATIESLKNEIKV